MTALAPSTEDGASAVSVSAQRRMLPSVNPAPGSLPPEWRAYARVAADRHHVFVDRAAAWLLGVDTYAWAELDLPLVPETCVIGDRRAARVIGVSGGTRRLSADDVIVAHGVELTSPLRTALDLGAVLRRGDAYAAMNALARAYRIFPADLVRELPRYRRRRGVVQLRTLAGLVDPRIESARESRVFLAIHDAGLPLPTPQVEVEVDAGGVRFRVDFAYERRRLAVEYDGSEFHAATPEQYARDRRRRLLLRDAGWETVVVTKSDFTGDVNDRWLRSLRERLAESRTNRRW